MSFRVLVADDDDLIRTLIVLALGAVGIKDTVAATDGREVMKLIQRQPFDLLMLDWHMPGKSGLEVVKAVRGRGSQVPIVMVSAEAARDHILEALRAGASDYILKPFDAKTLWSKIEKYRNAGCTSIAAKDGKTTAATMG
jgi:two-component system chemotaxis response regulator CheY